MSATLVGVQVPSAAPKRHDYRASYLFSSGLCQLPGCALMGPQRNRPGINHDTRVSTSCRRCLPQQVTDEVGGVRNHVIYYGEGLLVLAVNFSQHAFILQGQLIKSMALQLLLYRTIFQQAGRIKEAFIYTAEALARAAEAVDGETGNHILRVGEYSRV